MLTLRFCWSLCVLQGPSLPDFEVEEALRSALAATEQQKLQVGASSW